MNFKAKILHPHVSLALACLQQRGQAQSQQPHDAAAHRCSTRLQQQQAARHKVAQEKNPTAWQQMEKTAGG